MLKPFTINPPNNSQGGILYAHLEALEGGLLGEIICGMGVWPFSELFFVSHFNRKIRGFYVYLLYVLSKGVLLRGGIIWAGVYSVG
jgi:hypothetical protein